MAFEITAVDRPTLPTPAVRQTAETPVAELRAIEEVEQEDEKLLDQQRQLRLEQLEIDALDLELVRELEDRRLEEETRLALQIERVEIDRSAEMATELNQPFRMMVIGSMGIDIFA